MVEYGFMHLFDEVVEAFDDWVEFFAMVFVRVFAVIVELAFEDAEFDSIKRFGGLVLLVLEGFAFFGWKGGDEM